MMKGSNEEYNDEEMNNDRSAMLSGMNKRVSNRADAPDVPLCGFVSLQYYQPYFDVDTQDIKNRLLSAAMGFKNGEFMQILLDKPDLYGPFWIATSLIFLISVVSHFSSYVYALLYSKAEWSYDFQTVVNVASTVYGFVACVPAAVWIVLKQYEQPVPPSGVAPIPLNLVTAVSIYGYSLLAYIPATLLCLIPSEFVSWISFLAATIVSSLVLIRNIGPVILTYNVSPQHVPIALACLGSAQLLFMLIVKLSFFY